MNKLFREVRNQSNSLGMTLVSTREKLKPFVDDGVVHKDRKKDSRKGNDDNITLRKNSNFEERLVDYKVRIIESIQDKNLT
jgi:hypothetical protein